MDILKILSRGTKLTAKNTNGNGKGNGKGKDGPALPSAGAKVNPQLFHDPTGPTRGQKRKLDGLYYGPDPQTADGQVSSLSSSPDELPEVDFFAPNDEVAAAAATKEKRAFLAKAEVIPEVVANTVSQQLHVEECRQLLRSHRLKLTLLSGPEPSPATTEPRKSKKRRKHPPPPPPPPEKKESKKPQLTSQPLTSFAELRTRTAYGISVRLAENLRNQGYLVPTEVQMASLPLLLNPGEALVHADEAIRRQASERGGVDFLAVAPTGSGKTISFLVPVVDTVLKERAAQDQGGRRHVLRAVVVAPTRELASQIANEGRKMTLGTGVKIAAMKKGMRLAAEEMEAIGLNESEDGGDDDDEEEDDNEEDDDDEAHQANSSRNVKQKDQKWGPIAKADIIVTTPMLLLNFLGSGSKTTRKTLPTVASLILDEADVLLDPLFLGQTLGIWSACTNPNLRINLWSATMASNLETLIAAKLALRPSPAPFIRLVVGLKDTAVPNITHKLIYTASEHGKLLAIRQLLHPSSASAAPLRPPFLVFTQTIERAASLHEELKYDIPPEAGGPARIAALHSGLSDGLRAAIMRKFRAGEIWVLVTTDVLARGVDFAGVNGVVNYDVPGSAAAYVHRAGRTGRAGREGGIAVTLYTKEDIPFVKSVANVIAASENQAGGGSGGGNQNSLQKWLLDALPDVSKEDRKRLKDKGIESRRSGVKGAQITSKSGWERRREGNRRGAAVASKWRKKMGDDAGDEWGGFED